jgi:ubiquinone/menaquinone biosynthesis C-methylase UbiE
VVETNQPLMDFSNPAARKAFFAVHSNLPREGPGNRASTIKALDIANPTRDCARLLDVACGPGKQTLDLAEALPQTTLVATDLHPGFLTVLAATVKARGLAQRIGVTRADMRALPFQEASFDLIWCEGAAYIMGFSNALRAWAPLLKKGGRVALTEAVWLRSDPPDRVKACWEEYPQMTDIAGSRERIEQAGFTLIDEFVLPDEAWMDDYYSPMRERLKDIAPDFAGDPVAEAVLAECAEEITVFEQYSAYYGYVFSIVERRR